MRYSNVEAIEPTVTKFEVEEKAKNLFNSEADVQNALVKEITNYLGLRYRKGGDGERGIDCSAFVMIVYKNVFGIELPRTSYEQFKLGRLITNLDSLKAGDLLFFNTTGRRASHVGIYIGNNLFAHASVKEGVTISSIYDSYYKRRFNGAKRIIEVGSN
jgi:lipoprotein Spr